VFLFFFIGIVVGSDSNDRGCASNRDMSFVSDMLGLFGLFTKKCWQRLFVARLGDGVLYVMVSKSRAERQHRCRLKGRFFHELTTMRVKVQYW
jgi:hypothetical protein